VSIMFHQSRKERVAAQYGSARLAEEYAQAYNDPGPQGRFLRARLRLMQDVLASCPGGDLLDAGCGPGVMAQTLLQSRPRDFRIGVLDQSWAMVEYCAASARSIGQVYPAVGQLEALPYADATFDVTLVMGVLEYANASAAINEISRVTRPGGLVVITMLNPLSTYRIIEWIIYWPLLRVLGSIEGYLHVPSERRHTARATGIHAFTSGKLRRLMSQAHLKQVDLVYYNVTYLVPPLDRLPSIAGRAERTGYGRTATARWSHWLATGYLITAKRC
jgi:ubiquinone/menaquinone biosynthesis C-methylase UbiE